VAVTGGPSTYNVAVSGMTDGTVIATIAAGKATDAAGNPNTASTSTDNSVTFQTTAPPDNTAPTVTINQAAGQADPTSASPINFTVVFSESVSGFTETDVTIGGTAGGTKTVAVTGGPSTYNVAVSGMTDGTVIATIAAGKATDAAGNPNTASTSTDNTVTWVPPDTTPPPTIASFTPTSGPVRTIVTITGTNFTGASAVTFNTVSAAFMVDSATSIRAEVPTGATTGRIHVTTPGGTATSASNFSVEGAAPAPTIASFTPTSGPVGTAVTITGTNFTGASTVTFNTVSAAFIVDSATSIRAEVPTGATTGRIHVTTPGGTATSASDFTVTGDASVTRFEEDNAAVSASPPNAWVLRCSEVATFSDGCAGDSNVAGASVTFTFTGTAVSWIGLKCNICGIATVSIDGGPATTVDTRGPGIIDADPATPQPTSEPVFTRTGLAAGTHTLVITVTGDTTSSGTHIVVDAFDVTVGTGSAGPTNRIEDTDQAVSYTGTWLHGTDTRATGGTYAEAQLAGAVATLSFTGTEVRWLGYFNNNNGIARVSVDGTVVGEVDTYSASPALGVMFTAVGLSRRAHTLTIEVTGTKNQASTDTWVIIDAFDVTP
jgi:hypothetical protein